MRYLPLTKQNRQDMLSAIGVDSVEALYKDVPASAFIDGYANMPMKQGEMDVERILSGFAAKNHDATKGPFFLGAGCYYHHIPATADHIIQRSEFLTAYTPYQPEIAQGTLQVIYEFQTMIAMITGQDIANASLYDGATAMAEAVLMAMRLTRRNGIVLKGDIHPHYRAVLDAYMRNFPESALQDKEDDQTACIVVQYPDFHGVIHDLDTMRKKADETGAKLIVVNNEIVALGALPAPSQADIVCGEAQSVGLPMSFGGPHLGYLACSKDYVRQVPGRLCGETKDEDGKRSFVLTLNTREQHIRREKATSNICTNQGLCALAFSVHMALLGEEGFKHLAMLNHEKACDLADMLDGLGGFHVQNQKFFNEFVVQTPIAAQKIVDECAKKGIIAGYPVAENHLLVTATEMTRDTDIAAFRAALEEITK